MKWGQDVEGVGGRGEYEMYDGKEKSVAEGRI